MSITKGIGDWWDLKNPIDQNHAEIEGLQENLRIVKEVLLGIENRLVVLETKEVRRENLAKARKAKKK